jgi:hypothetical protein
VHRVPARAAHLSGRPDLCRAHRGRRVRGRVGRCCPRHAVHRLARDVAAPQIARVDRRATLPRRDGGRVPGRTAVEGYPAARRQLIGLGRPAQLRRYAEVGVAAVGGAGTRLPHAARWSQCRPRAYRCSAASRPPFRVAGPAGGEADAGGAPAAEDNLSHHQRRWARLRLRQLRRQRFSPAESRRLRGAASPHRDRPAAARIPNHQAADGGDAAAGGAGDHRPYVPPYPASGLPRRRRHRPPDRRLWHSRPTAPHRPISQQGRCPPQARRHCAGVVAGAAGDGAAVHWARYRFAPRARLRRSAAHLALHLRKGLRGGRR